MNPISNKLLDNVNQMVCLGIKGAMRTTPTNAVEALICLPH